MNMFYLDKSDLPEECIKDCSAQGSVDDAVDYWVDQVKLTCTRKEMIQGLKAYGNWTKEELEELDDRELKEKVLWLACCDFKEGNDSFSLEN